MVRQSIHRTGRVVGTICFLAFFLSSCSMFCPEPDPEIVREVEVEEKFIPIPHERDIPSELEDPFKPSSTPKFVSPSHEDAKAALTKEEMNNFQTMMFEMQERIRTWEEVEGIGEEEEEDDDD